MARDSTLYFRKSATLRSSFRLPCSNQNRVMSISPAGLAACHRQIAPTNVLWMSERIGAHRLRQDVAGQDLAFLEQIRILLLGVVVARHVTARLDGVTPNRFRTPSQHQQRG